MVIDKNRIVIGLLLILILVFSYFLNFDFLLLTLISFFIIFELFKCKFISNISDYIIIISLIFIFFLNEQKYLTISILNIFFLLFVLINVFFPNFYLKKIFFISVFIFIYNFLTIITLDRDTFYFIFFIAFLNDTFAYIFGKFLKGPLIIPSISPNKTWSGTLISFILSSFVIYNFNISIILSCLLSISLFFGDIFYSYIKRKNNLKDFSNFLQGHGGILDRIDSMFFFIIIINTSIL